MKYYHGTVVGNLETLKPFAAPFSNLKGACVYLSTNKALSLVYIWDRSYKWMTFSFREDGTPIYTESFKDSLKEFYSGVRGYIYVCEGDFSTKNKTGIRCAAVSEEPVNVEYCEIVEDVYELFLEYERQGKIIINRFDDLTQEQHESNTRMVRNCIKNLELLKSEHPLSSFVEEKYPDLWEEALREQRS